MTNKDQVLLAEAYSKICLNERLENITSQKYICVNQDNGEYHTFSDFDEAKNACEEFNSNDDTNVWVVKYEGEVVYPKESEVGISAYDIYRKKINPSNVTSDMSYAKKGEYVESFVHGIQPISEAKKKINPWAVEKSIKKKMEAKGKKVGPKKEEEIVKGIKKTAKKYGKKITSDKVKKK